MAVIPKSVLEQCPVLPGLHLRNRGKVRDTYDLQVGGPDDVPLILPVVTKRVSIFDFVLSLLIPYKDEVLNAVNIFWKLKLSDAGFKTDLKAFGSGIDGFLPVELRGKPGLQKVANVVSLAPTEPEEEDIVRFILTGSSVKPYQKDAVVCGHRLPRGLINGEMLPWPIYTPTTKAKAGHDIHITADSVAAKYGAQRERQVLQMAEFIKAYAWSRGLVFGDTKFEMFGRIILDEVGTPDSSRYFLRTAYEKMMNPMLGDKRKLPPSLDKQYVRNEGLKLGLSPDLDAEDPKNIAFAHGLQFSDETIRMTTLIYRFIAWKLFGMKLERFQHEKMGIEVEGRTLKVEIVVGSKSDLPQLEAGLRFLTLGRPARHRVTVMSCHRNQSELVRFVTEELVKADVVIAAAGKAAQLPADIKVKLCLAGYPEIPVIGVALRGATIEDDRDAIGSIRGLPGQPVEMHENGEPYFGVEGFNDACLSALRDEFLPRTIEPKPAEIGQWVG